MEQKQSQSCYLICYQTGGLDRYYFGTRIDGGNYFDPMLSLVYDTQSEALAALAEKFPHHHLKYTMRLDRPEKDYALLEVVITETDHWAYTL